MCKNGEDAEALPPTPPAPPAPADAVRSVVAVVPAPPSVFLQLRQIVRALAGAQDRGGLANTFGCNVSALTTQLEAAADEAEALRQQGSAESLLLRRQAAEAEAAHAAALKALNERVGRRDADLRTMHAKLKEARGQLVRVCVCVCVRARARARAGGAWPAGRCFRVPPTLQPTDRERTTAQRCPRARRAQRRRACDPAPGADCCCTLDWPCAGGVRHAAR
jgi:hypothetical protein